MKLPKMEERHIKKEQSKFYICGYTLNNPATFNQIKEATKLSESYLRYLILQLKQNKELQEIKLSEKKHFGKEIIVYKSKSEYVPIKYVRKSRFDSPQPQKILSDELISTVLEKLDSEPVKCIAIDLGIKVGTVYWIRSKYGNI